MARLYEVAIKREATDYAYIWAEDAKNAEEIASELNDQAQLEIILGDDGYEREEYSATEHEQPSEEDTKNGNNNQDAYREWIAKDGASI